MKLRSWAEIKAGAKGGRGPRAKEKDFGLNSSNREANSVANSIDAMKAAHESAGKALTEARTSLAKGSGGTRAAKDKIGEAFNTLQKAAESGKLTASTSGSRLAALPKYGDKDHPFMKAQAMNQEHSALVEKTSAMKSSLSRALTGDHESVSKAMGSFDDAHPRDENGRFAPK
jgi:hypothetical protein